MKKEENLKGNLKNIVKNQYDYRSRSHSPKAYLGCDTCKLKNIELLKKNKSLSKFGENNCIVEKNKLSKFKKSTGSTDRVDTKKEKVKLTDLCDDDKKRIVELIEELSKFAEKNQKLKEMLDRVQKTRQEQQEYIMKQANLHLEEKNFYINEINEHKSRIESLENEMKTKVLLWEKQERVMDTEIAYLTKSLQESANEKKDLNEQMNHLRICLRQSLESFQRLREDIEVLQHQEKLIRKFRSTSSQTETKYLVPKDKIYIEDVKLDEEFFSTSNHNSVDGKSSLDVINDKLEHVYQLLKRKSETFGKPKPYDKSDVDVSTLLKNEALMEEEKILINDYQDDDTERNSTDASGYKFHKPYDYCSKTSIQAERILKKIGKPLNVKGKTTTIASPRNYRLMETNKSSRNFSGTSNKKPVQQNNLFRSENGLRQCNEDKLLEDLFYTDVNLNLDGPESKSDDSGAKVLKKFLT